MKRMIAGLLLTTLLTGCGNDFEWFPENNGQPKTEPSKPTEKVESTDVGGFVSSDRATEGKGFVTMTTKGVFLTYTSLPVPKATPVTLEKHTDITTNLLIGRLLRAADRTALVQSIVALKP